MLDRYLRFEAMQRTPAFSHHFSGKNESWDERDKLVWEIEIRAFQSILPFLPKPWSALGMGSVRVARALNIPETIGKKRNLLKMARARKVPVIFTLGIAPSPTLLLKKCHQLLRREGKIVVGFIPRESPWGRFYAQTRKRRRSIQRLAPPYSMKKVEHMMMDAGFSIQGYFSTLFQKPGAVKALENPLRGYRPQAGFLVIVGERRD